MWALTITCAYSPLQLRRHRPADWTVTLPRTQYNVQGAP